MSIDRPDWSAPAPAMPSIQETHDAMVKGESPSPEVTRALTETTPAAPVPVPVRNPDGTIHRPDWSPKALAVYSDKSKDPSRPDWNVPARGESGQFISKSADATRQQWEREGGVANNVARVQAAEASMLALSPSLQTHFESLPSDIALIAADHLRLSPGYGRDAGARRFEQFLDALSEIQFKTFRSWWGKLTTDEQDAILGTVSLS